MATIQDHSRVRINAKGEITVPWLLFVNVHYDEVCDILRKKARLQPTHIVRPTRRTDGVKEFI